MFEQVISLGGWCQTAHQIKRRFGKTDGPFFDLLGTPFWAIPTLIRDGADDLCERFVSVAGGTNLRCAKHGIGLHHEVRRDGDGSVTLALDTLTQIRCRLQRRWRRLDDALAGGKRTLFVRHGGFNDTCEVWPYGPDDRPFDGGPLWSLRTAVAAAYPDLDFHIAFIWNEGVTNFDPKGLPDCATAHMMPVPHLPPEDMWKGSDAEWDAVFDHYA